MRSLRGAKDRHVTAHDEVDTEGSWAISYGDMVTLLLCFFILFFSIEPSSDKSSNLKQALVQVLLSEEKRAPASSEQMVEAPSMKLGKEQAPGIERIVEEWGGRVHQLGERVVVEFPGVSFFATAQVDLSKKGREQLQKFVQLYLPYAGAHQLAVLAYADPRPVKKSRVPAKFIDNLELSALRGVAAVRVLQEAGMPLARMRVGGFGEMRLTAEELAKLPGPVGENPERRALDLARKVMLVIQPDEKGNI